MLINGEPRWPVTQETSTGTRSFITTILVHIKGNFMNHVAMGWSDDINSFEYRCSRWLNAFVWLAVILLVGVWAIPVTFGKKRNKTLIS